MSRIKKAVIACILVTICMMSCWCKETMAATPRVMLSNYEVAGNTVTAGQEFTLKLTLQNTAARTTVRNLKVSIFTDGGEFLPVNSAGTAYLDTLKASETADFEFQLKALDGLEEKSYKVNVKTEYEDGNGNAYEVNDSIYLEVSLTQRISITDIYLDETEVSLSDTVEVCGTINNLGAGTLYNVTAHIEGENVMEQDSYIGNIESGKSGNVDALTKADMVSSNTGDNNKLIITYEDKAGNEYSESENFILTVDQPVYENLEKVKVSKDNSQVVKTVLIIVGSLAVLALIGLLSYRHYKKKKKMLDEI